MNRLNQAISSFVSVYLLSNQVIESSYTSILFNIIETDGTTFKMYNSIRGEFTVPVNGLFRLDGQIITSPVLSGVRIIKNGNVNFSIMSRVLIDTE
jgi:hypothetical protein